MFLISPQTYSIIPIPSSSTKIINTATDVAFYLIWILFFCRQQKISLMPLTKITGTLGKRIKSIREARNITQVKLAELADCDVRTIQRIENGEQFPSPTLFVKIINGLTITADDLIQVATTQII
jgi:DNA-binding XRE family transcriptional regulator